MRRALLAVLLAPPLAGLAVGLVFIALNVGSFGVESATDAASTVGLIVALVAVQGWPVALVLGLPLHLFLWRRPGTTIVHYALIGAAFGVIPLLQSVLPVIVRALTSAPNCLFETDAGIRRYCWSGLLPGDFPALDLPIELLLYATGGCTLAGASFWLIMTEGRLRRSTKAADGHATPQSQNSL